MARAQELLSQTFPDYSGAAVDSDSAVAYRALYPDHATAICGLVILAGLYLAQRA